MADDYGDNNAVEMMNFDDVPNDDLSCRADGVLDDDPAVRFARFETCCSYSEE